MTVLSCLIKNYLNNKTEYMKRILLGITIIFTGLIACNSKEEKVPAAPSMGMHQKADTTNVRQFANVAFASQRDTICGMPLKAGITDTLVYKNKIYGFCSPECKKEFATMLTKIK